METLEQLNDFFKDKKVLVTGHTGFKGSWLTYLLLKLNANVVGYSLQPPTNPNLFSILKLKDKIRSYIADIRDIETFKKVLAAEKPEIVLHLAAQPLVRYSYDEPLETYSTNILGTANVLQNIKETNFVKAAVIITTDKVYRDKLWSWHYRENDELGGHDPYSASKVCVEFVTDSYVRSFFQPKNNIFVASARAGNIIGGGDWAKDRLISDLVRAFCEEKKEVILRNPEAIRPWQYVLDPLFGYLLLTKKLYEGGKELVGAWNFAPNEGNHVTVLNIVKTAINHFKDGKYSVVRDEVKHETQFLKLDATKSKQKLKWLPVIDIDTALNWTFEWYEAYYSGKDVTAVTDQQINQFFEKWKSKAS